MKNLETLKSTNVIYYNEAKDSIAAYKISFSVNINQLIRLIGLAICLILLFEFIS